MMEATISKFNIFLLYYLFSSLSCKFIQVFKLKSLIFKMSKYNLPFILIYL